MTDNEEFIVVSDILSQHAPSLTAHREQGEPAHRRGIVFDYPDDSALLLPMPASRPPLPPPPPPRPPISEVLRRLIVSSDEEMQTKLGEGRSFKVWIATRASSLRTLIGKKHHGTNRLLVLDHLTAERRAALSTCFESIVSSEDAVILPKDELLEVISAPNRDELLIGGVVDADDQTVILYRANLTPIAVPFSWFRPSASSAPDFRRFAIIDHGQTVQLGDYEAGTDAILYEFDADYRRRQRAALRESERSFGASLRRLRLQRGVLQSDFPGISAKEISRIENGEIERPQRSTIETIAKRLGVRSDEISEY